MPKLCPFGSSVAGLNAESPVAVFAVLEFDDLGGDDCEVGFFG